MTATIVPETTDSTRSSPNLRERIDAHAVRTVEDLYAINGEPREAIRTKHTSYLTPLLVKYLTQVPFFALATANADGPATSPHAAMRPARSRSWMSARSRFRSARGTAESTPCATSCPIRTSGCSS